MRSTMVAVLFAAGCSHTGSTNTWAGAASMTALAVAASVASRAAGGCIAVCTNGTACNPQTGLCEVLPCRGRCQADQHCEVSFDDSRCVAGVTGVEKLAKGTSTKKIPIAAPPASAPSSSGPPVIVPKAEDQPPR